MEIIEAFRKAQVIQEEYKAYSLKRDYPISLDDLTDVVANYIELPIKIRSVGFDAKNINARLSRYPDRAEIDFSASLNLCNKRYAVTKELSQLIIDTPDSFTKDFGGLVAGLVDDSFKKIDQDANESENIAHFVACELLLPFDIRDNHINLLNKEETTFYKIALKHRMPEAVVERILHSPVHEALRNIMEKL